jgi:hypothetical protein
MIIVSPSRGLIKVPIDGKGADIQAGAILIPGVTTAGSGSDDNGCAILAGEDGADAIGLLVALHDYSVVGDSDVYTGAKHVMAEVDPFYPGCLVAAEIDTTDTMAIASMQSTTQIRVSSIEAATSGSWLYAYSGTGLGQLAFVIYNDDTDLFIKSALTTTWVAADTTLVKINPIFHRLHHLNATMTKIGTDAAAGTWTARTIRNQFKYDGQEGWIDLDPSLHHNMQLNGLHPVFRSIVCPVNTFMAPID